MMNAREIRDLTGLNRVKFCEKYHIPERTYDDWEHGRRVPADYILEMLRRIVEEDMKGVYTMKYYVYYITKTEEFLQGTFADKKEAIDCARNEWNRLSEFEKKDEKIEIRVYTKGSLEEADEADCFDYNLVTWDCKH